jgi:hypothetical protein
MAPPTKRNRALRANLLKANLQKNQTAECQTSSGTSPLTESQKANPEAEPHHGPPRGRFVLDELEEDEPDYAQDWEGIVDDLDLAEGAEEEILAAQNTVDASGFLAAMQTAQENQSRLDMQGRQRKRKHHYTGDAPRTKRRWAQLRRELRLKGQKSILDFFQRRTNLKGANVSNHIV